MKRHPLVDKIGSRPIVNPKRPFRQGLNVSADQIENKINWNYGLINLELIINRE